MEPMTTEEPRFPALIVISIVLKILALIVAIIGVILSIASLFAAISVLARLGSFVVILITAAVQALLLWAGGELILLLISLEHNTYLTKEAIAKGEMRPAA